VLSPVLIGGLYMLCICTISFSRLLLYSIVTVLRSGECATAVHLAFEILLLMIFHIRSDRIDRARIIVRNVSRYST
jgi:hypothetical protein